MTPARKKLEMIIKEMDRVAILIDGYTTHNATKSIKLKINWQEFQNYFMELGRLRYIGYYLTIPSNEGNFENEIDVDSLKFDEHERPWWFSIVNWMSYNNFNVTIKRGREFQFTETNGKGIKTSLDITIAIEAMKLDVDHVIFLTCNTEHHEIVNALQSRGIVVTVMGNSHKQLEARKLIDEREIHYPFTASKKLIKSANHFIDFVEIWDDIAAN